MKPVWKVNLLGTVFLAGAATLAAGTAPVSAQGQNTPSPAAIDVRDEFNVPPADAQATTIVDAANAFLATLSAEQRSAVIYPFTDNAQRSNWSNLPEGLVQRGGVKRGDLSEEQLAALDTFLGTVMSADGLTNIRHQLASEDQLESRGGGPAFGSEFYYVSFLGEPATEAPWMFQFGGHHLAINVTFHGPDASFSPMLTGGQPLRITYEGEPVYITKAETAAARAFMDSLDDARKEAALRGRKPINLLSGPGEFGTAIAPEGVKGSDLSEAQKALLLSVIEARLGFINPDDFAAAMETARERSQHSAVPGS